MEVKDLKLYSEGCNSQFITKDRFLFDNGKFRFYYRWLLTYFTKRTWGGCDDATEYTVSLMVDDEYIHESRRDETFKTELQPFLFKRVEKRGEFDMDVLVKTLNSAIKLKIESKIKVNKYKKLKEILNGFSEEEETEDANPFPPFYIFPSDYNDVEEQGQIRGAFLYFVDENRNKEWFDELLDKAKTLERKEYFDYCDKQDIDFCDGYNVYEYLRGPFKNCGLK